MLNHGYGHGQSCSDRLEDRDRLIDQSLFRDRVRDHRSLRKDRNEIEIERAGIENQFDCGATYESQSKLLSFSLIFQTTRLFTWC